MSSSDRHSRHVTELLPAYVIGTLDVLEAERVRVHLIRCNDCRTELIEWQAVRMALRTPSFLPSRIGPLRLALHSRTPRRVGDRRLLSFRRLACIIEAPHPTRQHFTVVLLLALSLLSVLASILAWQIIARRRAPVSPTTQGDSSQLS